MGRAQAAGSASRRTRKGCASRPGRDRAFGPPAPRRADLRCSGGHRVLGSARRRRWRWSHLGQPVRPGKGGPTPGTRSIPVRSTPARGRPRRAARSRLTCPARRRVPAGSGDEVTSRSPAAGARSSSGACPSRRRCCPRGGIIQGAGLGHHRGHRLRARRARSRGSGGPSPTGTPRRPRRRSWLIFFISAAVLLVVFFGLGQYWQYEIRGLMGVTDYNIALVVASPFVAALVFCLHPADRARPARPVPLGRAPAPPLDRPARGDARSAGSWWPASPTWWSRGLLLDGLRQRHEQAHISVRDTTTAEGVHQPTTSLRSGGPGSLVPWDSLGWQGRNFIGKGPSASDIEKVTQHAGHGADPGLRRAGVGLRRRGPGRPGRPATSSARAGSSARTCWW